MDRASIENLYRKYGPMVLRRARAILGEEQAAKDAMQEVFIRAIQAGREFRGEASPATWLYRVTTNYCLNVVRDQARRRELLAASGAPGEWTESRSPERLLTLAQLLPQIPEELCEIAVYYYVDQMSQQEIALLLGMSRRTVSNRLERFRSIAQELVADRKKALP